MKQKLAMIGVDAADLDFVRAHLGSLPTFGRVIENGAARRIESTAGLLTGSVWPSFYTASSPGEHGIYHHLQWDAGRMRLRRVSPEWLDCRPFWRDMEQRGLRVTALDVPMTLAPRLERGIEVNNWGSHDQLGPCAATDPELARQIRRRFGSHPMGAEIPVSKSPDELRRIRASLVEGARRKGELARWLLGAREWDFVLTVFGETHRGGHILWPEPGASPEALLEVYRAVDHAIGRLLHALDLETTTVILFALHGMGSNTSQEHFVPRLLDRINARWSGSAPSRGQAPQQPGQRSLMRTLREKIPARAQNAIAQAVPVKVRDWVVIRQISSGHNWARTPGFPLLADLNGYLRLNLRGREQQGMLEAGSDQAKRYLDWLAEALRGFRVAPTGQPLAREIRLAQDAFPGRRLDHLPDVIIEWQPEAPASEIVSEKLGVLRSTLATGRGGNHRPQGFCAILGWDEKRGPRPVPTHITDLAGIAARLSRTQY